MTHDPGRRSQDPRVGARARGARGSIVVTAYFVLVAIMGVAIPQTLRSVSNARVAHRYADQDRLSEFMEAGLDRAIFLLYAQPQFGDTDDDGQPGAIADCSGGGTPWDCYAGTNCYSGTYNPPGSSCAIRARNLGSFQNAGMTRLTRKQVRITSTLSATGEQRALEAVVEVVQPYQVLVHSRDGVRVGSNASLEMPVRIISSGADVVHVANSGIIKGKVTVGNPVPGVELCCNNAAANKDAIALEAAGTPGSLRRTSDGASMTLPIENGVTMPGDQDAPQFWPVSWGPLADAIVPPVSQCASPLADPNIPINEVWTFCPEGETCMNGATNGDIGKVQPDGSMQYCFQALQLNQNAQVKFMAPAGGKVDVIANGQSGGTGRAFYFGVNTRVLSCPTVGSCGDATASIIPRLTVHVPSGNGYGVYLRQDGRLYGDIDAPNALVTMGLGAQVFASNGPVVSQYLDMDQGAIIRNISATPGPELGAPQMVRLLGWRRCRDVACTL